MSAKMPGPPAPFVPVPLPNLGRSADRLSDATSTVTIEGKKVAIRAASILPTLPTLRGGARAAASSVDSCGQDLLRGPGLDGREGRGQEYPVARRCDDQQWLTDNSAGTNAQSRNAYAGCGGVASYGRLARTSRATRIRAARVKREAARLARLGTRPCALHAPSARRRCTDGGRARFTVA